MSFQLLTVLLVAVLAFSTEAALPARTLLQESDCTQACEAARRTDPNTLRALAIRLVWRICRCRCNEQGWTPIHVSVESRCHQCFRSLYSRPSGCSLSSTDYSGNTAMHVAARLCRLAIVDTLIPGSAPRDSTNDAGDTPLCIASRQNDENCGQIVRNLLADGVRPCVRCSDGRTPCGGCVNRVVCDVLRQDEACNCS